MRRRATAIAALLALAALAIVAAASAKVDRAAVPASASSADAQLVLELLVLVVGRDVELRPVGLQLAERSGRARDRGEHPHRHGLAAGNQARVG